MATLDAFDGFEHGPATLVAGTGPDNLVGTVVTVTSPVRTGTRALEISPAGAAENAGYGSSSVTIRMQAFYIRFTTLPSADCKLAFFLNATSGNAHLWFDNTNDKFAVNIGGAAFTTGGPVITTDTWYRVVLEYDTSSTTGVIRCQIDNGTEFSQNGTVTANAATASRLGTDTTHTYTAFYDDWITSSTDGDYEEVAGWESHRVESLIPNSDGTHNIATSGDFDSFTGTAFSNSTTNGNTFIAHRPLQRANTANQVIRQELGGTSDYMEFGNENLSDNTDPVDGVRTYATHIESAASGASLGEARLLLSDNTEVLTSGSISAINSTEDPGTTVTTRDRGTIAPSGGWDGTKVDGLKWRIGFADNAPDVNFIDLMVEVAQHVEAAASDQDLTGAAFTKAGTFPSGTLTAEYALTGAAFTKAPTFPTGQIDHEILGAVFTKAGTFPTGSIQSDQILTGAVFAKAGTFPSGTIVQATELAGATFQRTPTFPAGRLDLSLAGVVFQRSGIFPSSSITSERILTGAVFVRSGTFPAGTITVGPVSLLGSAFLRSPTFPGGTIAGGGQGTPANPALLEDRSGEGNLTLVTQAALLEDMSTRGVLEEVE